MQVLDHRGVPPRVRVVLLLQDGGGGAAVAGEEQQQVVLEVVERLGAELQRLGVRRVSSVPNSKQVMPPKAAMYWSCLPIGSPSSVDLDVAGLLGQLARVDDVLAVACAAPCSSAVVKLPDEPSPVPAGMSAMLVISSDGPSKPTSFSASRTIGCCTSATLATRSSCEYLTISSGTKV